MRTSDKKSIRRIKTYVITLSKVFPAICRAAGQPTGFSEKTLSAIKKYKCNDIGLKLHTIRANYMLWRKRFVEIDAGNAVLSVRQWMGKPYRSKQIEIARLTNTDGIGLQKLEIPYNSLEIVVIDESVSIDIRTLACNDGLNWEDWREWFVGYDLTNPMAVIHFTSFRY